MGSDSTITRSPSTALAYSRIFRRFEREVRKTESTSPNDDVNPVRVALLFNEREGDWEVRTARLYRQALLATLRERAANGDEAASHAIEVINHQHEAEEDRVVRKDELRRKRQALRATENRTSRRKVKRFGHDDAVTLISALGELTTQSGEQAAAWFAAGWLTGLRPSEWETARLDYDPRMVRTLVVQNAKATNGRAHGTSRTLVLSRVTDAQMKVLSRHMENVREAKTIGDGFEALYNNCRRAVRVTAERLWPRRDRLPTLYTARHMFAADAKSVFDHVGVAALMGHASTDTQTEHYAPRWSGSGGLAVEPGDLDVAAVAARNQHRLEQSQTLSRRSTPSAASTDWIAQAAPTPKKG